jgi:hypothetical protein
VINEGEECDASTRYAKMANFGSTLRETRSIKDRQQVRRLIFIRHLNGILNKRECPKYIITHLWRLSKR